ncbi:MAG: A/G-specific adenine glycosylase [Lachnospiraceae bacterium]|nr:A/G-specific adenine glycosylase [Lachnospiraceae bacterium]
MLEDYDLKNLISPALAWFEANKRDLPWRKTKDPYGIWVSEIMLQQTRVEAVKGYYERFLDSLPDISSLAQCEEDRLLKLWEGLGYYNRVRNMQKAARLLVEKYEGRMPADYSEVLHLPGIGAYTAGAIASIAFDIPAPAVDGNVLRILCRVAEDDSDIRQEKTKKKVTDLLFPIMPSEKPGSFNQAMMEIGAIRCLPNAAPLCEKCPWKDLCGTRRQGAFERYPYRSPLKERRIEKRTVLLIMDGERIAIEKRPKEGLLAGLYQFPNLLGHLTRREAVDYVRQQGPDPVYIETLPAAKHVFSHIEWQMRGYLIRVSDLSGFGEEGSTLLLERDRIQKEYAIPSAFAAYTRYINLEKGK